jgi:hypothetical protein
MPDYSTSPDISVEAIVQVGHAAGSFEPVVLGDLARETPETTALSSSEAAPSEAAPSEVAET